MLTRLRSQFAASLLACAIAGSAYAQDISGAAPAPAPANLAFVEGAVEVVQGGVVERADPPVMLLEGDGVRARNGRAELVFGDGTLIHMASDGELEILGDERLRLLTGRLSVRLSHAAAQQYVVDTPLSSVRLEPDGEYGIDVDRGGRLQVTVARGAAHVDDAASWSLRGGQMITLVGTGGRPLIEPFNSARWDAFTSWAHERATSVASSASAEQLPYELRPYAGVLDQHGRWDYVAPHGHVWFPSVGASWRPYYEGSWSFTRYGWTWHGRDRWAWPTHHYGRWEFTGASWYWIPARVWAPAWVTWSVGAGYVSWAPLGWHRPDRFDSWDRRDHPAFAPRYSPWRGWTVLPRQHFGPRRSVRAHAVDGDRLDDAARHALLSRATPYRPSDDRAVPRSTADVRGNVRRPPVNVPSGARRAPGRPAAAAGANAPDAGSARRPARATDAPRSTRDDNAYAPPRSWSGAAGRAGSSDRAASPRITPRGADRSGAAERRGDTAERRQGARRADPGGRSDAGGRTDVPARRGTVRDPGTRAAPRSTPAGGARATSPRGAQGSGARANAPRSRAPQSKPSGAAGGAAVPRAGGSRPKG